MSLSFAQAEAGGTSRPDNVDSAPILYEAWSRALELRASAVAALDRVQESLSAAIATARQELSSPEALSSGNARGALLQR